jgi:hypothetical protein
VVRFGIACAISAVLAALFYQHVYANQASGAGVTVKVLAIVWLGLSAWGVFSAIVLGIVSRLP